MKLNQHKWLGVSALSIMLAACGGGSDSRPELPGAPDPVSSSSSVSSSAGSSSSAGNEEPNGVILHETFNVSNGAEFFSVDYKPLPGAFNDDPHPSMYFPIAGFELNPDPALPSVDPRILVGDGKLTITSSSRFSIGQHSNVRNRSTTGFDTGALGALDLSQPWKISFCLVNATSTDVNSKVEFYVDNNTTGLANSRHGNNNRILSVATPSYVSHIGSRVVVSVPGVATPVADRTNTALENATNSFLQFRVSGANDQTTVTISDLWIGLQDAEAPTACEAGEHLSLNPPANAPAAPTVTAGDSQLTVTWNAVERASGYDVAWNTTDTPPTDTAQIVSASGLEQTITGLTNGTNYYVFVRAKNAGGATAWSASTSGSPVAAVVVPDAPTGLTAQAGNGQVLVSWDEVSGVLDYTLAYSTTDDVSAATEITAITDNSYVVTDLADGTTYYFFISATNSAGQGAYSQSVSATTLAAVSWLTTNADIFGDSGSAPDGSLSENGEEISITANGGNFSSNAGFRMFLATQEMMPPFYLQARIASIDVTNEGNSGAGNSYGYGLAVIESLESNAGGTTYENTVPRFATLGVFPSGDPITFSGSRAHKLANQSGTRSRSNVTVAVGSTLMRIEVTATGVVRCTYDPVGDTWTRENSSSWGSDVEIPASWNAGFYSAPSHPTTVVFDQVEHGILTDSACP
ncbi:fibronectin type III domain-containing protein [Cellvibrio sp. ARAG 10.3]|uniref:fibronectin type III domain-containing protein n=1 Tax=Cellvibrio sp. ARAG 10.3 TaxID=3451358 RepID=UPI003F478A6F